MLTHKILNCFAAWLPLAIILLSLVSRVPVEAYELKIRFSVSFDWVSFHSFMPLFWEKKIVFLKNKKKIIFLKDCGIFYKIVPQMEFGLHLIVLNVVNL